MVGSTAKNPQETDAEAAHIKIKHENIKPDIETVLQQYVL